MAKAKNSDETIRELLAVHGGNRYTVAQHLGVTHSSLCSRVRRMEKRGEITPTIEADLPPEEIDVTELVERRKRQFERKDKHHRARKLINCRVPIDGPYGLLIFGDPHVDDDGTDLSAIERHMAMTKEYGVWGCSVGDITNNWVGRLAKLYAEQSTSAAEAWALAEWFIKGTDWLFLCGGNHDAWSGAGDPINWISRQTNAIHQSSEVRLSLNQGKRSVRVNCRHDFAGHSQYNPVHGPTKSAMFGQSGDNLYVCGHKHACGYGVLKHGSTGITQHLLRVASYKIYDRFAMERGFRDQNISPAAFVVIDQSLPETHPDLLKVFWEPEEGLEVLRWKRARTV